ncbi:Glutaredoxin [Tetrabaena socialis]|uniref:Glutaredoxin n=1 Tax=Tetrabaena socialis TaxID=47790 RepID=A0A2J7ZM75_9CHLO|nr:Glutaredoxin [Tetrabaena socialis]|eukprot:PNH01365.1 Glutaredoxin [Tetrabaena socialis]
MASLLASRQAFTACRATVRRSSVVRTMASKADSIKETVAANKVVVYSKTYCPYCTRAKGLLSDLKVPFKVLELDTMGAEGTELQDALQTITGRRTVPQVFVGGKFLGGCDDTVAAHASGSLKTVLGGVGISI